MGYFSEMSIDMQNEPMAPEAQEAQPFSLEPPEYEAVGLPRRLL